MRFLTRPLSPVRLAVAFGLVLAWSTPAAAQPAKKRVAGIEIASTAVRAIVIEYQEDRSAKYVPLGPDKVDGLEKRTGLVDLAVKEKRGDKEVKVYPEAALEAVVRAVGEFATSLSQTHRDLSFTVVASSGVTQAAVNARDLIKMLKDNESTKNLPELILLDQAEVEVRFAFEGVVPAAQRRRSISIDIGGSNVKFGFPAANEMVSGELGFGTNVFLTRVDESLKASKPPGEPAVVFSDRAAEVWKKEGQAKLADRASMVRGHIDGGRRDTYYIVGGAAFAVSTLMYKDLVAQEFVPIKYGDLKRFRNEFLKENKPLDFGNRPPPGSEAAARLVKDLSVIENRFGKIEQKIAAAELLAALFVAFKIDQDEKTILFARNSLFAWLKGFVEDKNRPKAPLEEQLKEQFSALNEEARDIRVDQAKYSKEAKDAAAKLQTALENLGKKFDDLKFAQPDDVRAVERELAQIRQQLNQLDGIKTIGDELKTLREFLQKNWPPVRNDPDPTQTRIRLRSDRAWQSFYRGVKLARQGQADEAVEHLTAATKEDGTEPGFWYTLGLLQLMRGRDDDARVAAHHYLRLLELGRGPAAEIYESICALQGTSRAALGRLIASLKDRQMLLVLAGWKE